MAELEPTKGKGERGQEYKYEIPLAERRRSLSLFLLLLAATIGGLSIFKSKDKALERQAPVTHEAAADPINPGENGLRERSDILETTLEPAEAEAMGVINEATLQQNLLVEPAVMILNILNGDIDKESGDKVINAWTPQQLKAAITKLNEEIETSYAGFTDFQLGKAYERYETLQRAAETFAIVMERAVRDVKIGNIDRESDVGVATALSDALIKSYLFEWADEKRTDNKDARPSIELFARTSGRVDMAIGRVPTSDGVEDKEAKYLIDGFREPFDIIRNSLGYEYPFMRGLSLRSSIEARLAEMDRPASEVEGAGVERGGRQK